MKRWRLEETNADCVTCDRWYRLLLRPAWANGTTRDWRRQARTRLAILQQVRPLASHTVTLLATLALTDEVRLACMHLSTESTI